MEELAYQIRPALMGGVVKETAAGMMKINLHGRLGILYVPESLLLAADSVQAGTKLEFYFSYIQVTEHEANYDCSTLKTYHEFYPCLIGGKIIEVNDTAAKMQMMEGLGTVAVPRRWMFTAAELAVGQTVEFYLSCMRIVDTKEA